MAKRYQKMLLAVDFHEDNKQVIDTAKELSSLYGAELHVIHVNEPLGMAYTADGVSWGDQVYQLEASIRKESEAKMAELSKALALPEGQCHSLEGRPSSCIHNLCESGQFDLIVLGTHGQAGLQLLLGSTANSVLHGAQCDVLAVRLKD